MCKLLGINWDDLRDEFAFDFSELLQHISKLPNTKKTILKLTVSLFDPLGLLIPFVIMLNTMFQDLCTSQVNWDNQLPVVLMMKLEVMMKELKNIAELRVPRCCFVIELYPVSVRLHRFSDVSVHAYAAVLCISSTYNDGCTEVRLLCSKLKSPLQRNKRFRGWNFSEP